MSEVQHNGKILYMTAGQLREVLEHADPDGDDSEAEISLMETDAEMTAVNGDVLPPGLYMWFTEYPEEGMYGPITPA